MTYPVAETVIALVAAVGLAMLASHRKFREFRQRAGINMLISAGLFFLLLGAAFGHKRVGILTPDVLGDLQPALEFGLGWIGFAVGMQLDVGKLDRLPLGLDGAVAAESVFPMVLGGGLCGAALLLLGVPLEGSGLLREVLLLAACAAPSARVDAERMAQVVGRVPAENTRDITSLDDLAALGVLGLIAAFFRPEQADIRWSLPPSAWVLATLGLGGVVGIVTYMLVRRSRSEAEEVTLLIGAVALSAGAAGYLALSVPVVCTLAGALVASLPHRDIAGLRQTLRDVEQPLYLVFLLIVGATWRPTEWQGWVLAIAFVSARVIGKGLGAWLARGVKTLELPPVRRLWLALVPQSPISIVVMVAASTSFHGWLPERVRWATNAVVVGSAMTEVVSLVLERVTRRPVDSTPAGASA